MSSKHSEETKLLLSKKRKEWLKNNPDKHPWRNKDKFKSIPCEKVKEFLKRMKIEFIEEFQPMIEDRTFSIDIAMPDKLIALEINGNQHYERDGSLKLYYQQRHDLLEKHGWDVYEIHYSACFNLEKWKDFIEKLQKSDIKVNFDYFNYKPILPKSWRCLDCDCSVSRGSIRCRECNSIFNKHKPKVIRIPKLPKNYKCPDCGISISRNSVRCKPCSNITRTPKSKNSIPCICGNEKHKNAKQCMSCYNNSIRMVERPSKEDLELLVLKFPLTKLGEKYGVSDNAVRKWCKSYGITNLPNNKYRQRKFWENIGE